MNAQVPIGGSELSGTSSLREVSLCDHAAPTQAAELLSKLVHVEEVAELVPGELQAIGSLCFRHVLAQCWAAGHGGITSCMVMVAMKLVRHSVASLARGLQDPPEGWPSCPVIQVLLDLEGASSPPPPGLGAVLPRGAVELMTIFRRPTQGHRSAYLIGGLQAGAAALDW